ncbi:MAG: GntR family transcriptional regulator [Christensenellales bacterium]
MLDNQNFVPLYQQVEEMLRRKIQTGEYQPSMRLPSEAELAAQFGVSTITVKKAVLNLVEQGLLKRKQGKGTFVVFPKQNRDLRQVVSFSESCRLNGTKPGSKTLEQCVIPAPLFVKEALECQENHVIFISRLRFVDSAPMAVETNWFPMAYSFLLDEDLNNRSLFDLLYQKKTPLMTARRSIEICNASSKESQLLQVAPESALLLIQSIVYNPSETPIFVGKQVINAEHFKVIV